MTLFRMTQEAIVVMLSGCLVATWLVGMAQSVSNSTKPESVIYQAMAEGQIVDKELGLTKPVLHIDDRFFSLPDDRREEILYAAQQIAARRIPAATVTLLDPHGKPVGRYSPAERLVLEGSR